MKVLILGGTGAMGVHLVQLLESDSVEVVVTSRRPMVSKGHVQYIQGNAHDIEFLQTLLKEKWDAIVDFMVYTTESFKERFKFLLAATSQYVFISSARVYANSNTPIIEDSPRLIEASDDLEFLSTDEYSLTKAKQENALMESKRSNWTIIRPYITYSKDRLQLGVLEKEEWLYRALHNRTIVFSKDIYSKLTTLTYGLDVSFGIKSLIGNPFALGEFFHITSNDSNKWSEIFNIYLEVLETHLGSKPKIVLDDLEDFLALKESKYQVLYDRLFNRKFDNSKILQHIDKSDFTKVNEGLKKCLEDFLKKPEFKKINWKFEALKDRQTKEMTPLKEITNIKQKIKYILFRYLIH